MKQIILNTILIRWQTSKPIISKNERIDLSKASKLMQEQYSNVEYDPNSQIQQIVLRRDGFTYLFFSTGKIQVIGKSFSEAPVIFLNKLFEICLKNCIIKLESNSKLSKCDIKKVKEARRVLKRLEFV